MKSKSTDNKLSRDDIIAAVAELIAEQGLENLTMRNIARHVGCSVGTLPHYFDGKDDIVIAALNWSNERIFSRLGSMPLDEMRLEYLYPLISTAMPIDQQSDIEWRVRLCLWDYAVTNEDMRSKVNDINETVTEMLTGLLVHLQKSGDLTDNLDSEVTALTLYQMCIGGGFNMLHYPIDQRQNKLKSLFNYIESIRR
ncbi:HTH-type transcriptional regulator BetI [BD1-7 clade bacterium]|uniref:HTH-type transcriptional regulator BetI n=1 Tax=BD1-7 clade bacterium TaxID=2029982 RepID=A0A5S9P4H8_9GAMM|nr:HTH-type transcriptional regulator BetI [BD1-7 clade bacterium]CAA0098306.1 HTH-type transcriptional regulator BetI [BD1-7 clade bacterium]